MSDKNLVSKYKNKLENNKLFSFIVILAFIISSITAAVGGIKSVFEYFTPPTLEEKVTDLAKKGCILFLPDSSVPESQDLFILNAYKEFWRNSDIYYADRIEIDGITYHKGSSAYNMSIGERKASAAAKFLEDHARIVPDQTEIIIKSYGEERPLERVGEYECGAFVRVFHDKK